MADNNNTGFPVWIIFLVIGILAITGLIIFLIVYFKKKNRVLVVPNFIVTVINDNQVRVSWDKNDPGLHDSDNINVFATLGIPIIEGGIVTNKGVVASEPVKATQYNNVILKNLDRFEGMQIYITITITGDDINLHESSIQLVYMEIYPPPSDEVFQIEPIGIDGNIEFITNGCDDPVYVHLVSSSASKINNYFSYNDVTGEGQGTYPNQLMSMVHSTHYDMGPWVLKRNGNTLEAVPRSTITDLDAKYTQWTYINNYWCSASDPTACIVVDNPITLPSTVSIGKISGFPNDITQEDERPGQRWRNVIRRGLLDDDFENGRFG
jgi:hypothetical protein